MELETERLIIKTNITIENGELKCIEYPGVNDVSIFDRKSNNPEDGCFVFYEKDGEKRYVGDIYFVTYRGRFEIKYTTKEEFRDKGYMSEALLQVVLWIFKNASYKEMYALITDNPRSQRVAEKVGFRFSDMDGSRCWFKLMNPLKS